MDSDGTLVGVRREFENMDTVIQVNELREHEGDDSASV